MPFAHPVFLTDRWKLSLSERMTLYNSLLLATQRRFLRLAAATAATHPTTRTTHTRRANQPTTRPPHFNRYGAAALKTTLVVFLLQVQSLRHRRSFNETKHLVLRKPSTVQVPSLNTPSDLLLLVGERGSDHGSRRHHGGVRYLPCSRSRSRSRSRSVVCRWMIVRDELLYIDPTRRRRAPNYPMVLPRGKGGPD
jgi:hypothetical protein